MTCPVCDDRGRVAVEIHRDKHAVELGTRPCSAPGCVVGAVERANTWYDGGATMEAS